MYSKGIGDKGDRMKNYVFIAEKTDITKKIGAALFQDIKNKDNWIIEGVLNDGSKAMVLTCQGELLLNVYNGMEYPQSGEKYTKMFNKMEYFNTYLENTDEDTVFVSAMDYDDEGVLIFKEVMQYFNINLDRCIGMKIISLSPESIQKNFENMEDYNKFSNEIYRLNTLHLETTKQSNDLSQHYVIISRLSNVTRRLDELVFSLITYRDNFVIKGKLKNGCNATLLKIDKDVAELDVFKKYFDEINETKYIIYAPKSMDESGVNEMQKTMRYFDVVAETCRCLDTINLSKVMTFDNFFKHPIKFTEFQNMFGDKK